MLKIGKGLKKKKKSKKNKHREEELFTEEELEQYKKEHSQKVAEELQEASETESVASEELEKFKQLTAGVDDILRRTQGNLDRIKKESFFQRKPTPSELKAQEEKEKEFQKQAEEAKEKQEEEEKEEESESESEFDDRDDIFDTAYVDALESGKVKLAYFSDDDDDTYKTDGPDPFDTSSAEEILKKAEELEKKKKLEISLGLAATVLSGRAERDKSILAETGAAQLIDQTTQPILPNKPKKRSRKIQDVILIGSFDEGSNFKVFLGDSVPEKVLEAPKSLLDYDLDFVSLPKSNFISTEVHLKKPGKTHPPTENSEAEDKTSNLKDLVNEFDIINEGTPEVRKAAEVEDEFDEFSALAASSVANQKLEEELQKFEESDSDPFDTSSANIALKQEPADPFGKIEENIPSPVIDDLKSSNQKWSAFEPEEEEEEEDEEEEEETETDPFDTAFADKIQPGKCELKLLEKEILGDIEIETQKSDVHVASRILSRNNSDCDFNPRAEDIILKLNKKLGSKVSIQITDPSGFVETQRGSESEFREGDLVFLNLKHRDLLGGSTTDLTKVGDEPLPPEVESSVEDFSKYSDPFDTSIADQTAVPGKAELLFIEKELLSDIQRVSEEDSLSDTDFDPRKEENSCQKVTRNIPSPITGDLLSTSSEEVRPLTPYCPSEKDGESETCKVEDPFDTSYVTLLPGKQELKLIERELNSIQPIHIIEDLHKNLGFDQEIGSNPGIHHSLSDPDFNPREGTVQNQIKVNPPGAIRRYSDVTGLSHKPPSSLLFQPAKPDLLVVEEEVSVKALTPTAEEDISSYIDPFDTSIAENIAPGKAELKVLERELIPDSAEGGIKRSYTDPDFNPREDKPEEKAVKPTDILNLSENLAISTKPLTPLEFQASTDDDIDPFDTSIASNLLPGKAEIRVLESEFFEQ